MRFEKMKIKIVFCKTFAFSPFFFLCMVPLKFKSSELKLTNQFEKYYSLLETNECAPQETAGL